MVKDLEEKAKKQKLQERKKWTNEIFSKIKDVAWSISWPDLEVEFISKSIEEIIGYSREDFEEEHRFLPKITHPDDKYIHEKTLEELEEEGNVEREFRLIGKDGSIIWIHERCRMIYDKKGNPVRIEGIARDITPRKEMEEELKLNKFALDHAPLEVFLVTPDGKFEYVNEKACKRLSYTRDELLEKRVSHVDVNYSALDRKKIWKDIKEKKTNQIETNHQTKKGEVFPVEITSRYLKYKNREYEFAFAQDITKRKKAEEKIKKTKNLLENLTEQVPGGLYQFKIRPDGTYDFPYISQKFHEIFKVNSEEFKENLYEILHSRVHPDDLNKVIKPIENQTTDLTIWQEEFRFYLPQKGMVWLEGIAKPEKKKDGSIIWYGNIRNITERKEQEIIIKKLHGIALDFKKLEDEQEICQETIKAAENLLHFNFCTIDLLEGETLISKATSEEVEVEVKPRSLSETSILSRTYKENKNFIIDNIPNHPDADPIKTSFKSGLSLPVGKYGVFQAISTGKKDFDQNDLELAEILISHTTAALDRIKSQKKIRYQTFHDGLTGLYNRKFIKEEMVRLDTPRQLPISIIMTDINGLKIINDSLGHKKGDELLQKTAQILENAVREEDILARYGGDEFLILLPQTDSEEADNILERIKNNCVKTKTDTQPISLGIGTATKNNDSQNIKAVLTEADNNMYQDKLLNNRSQKNKIVKSLLNILEAKSGETKVHAQRITNLAYKLGEKIGLDNYKLDRLSLLATLHDIGKVSIPENILNKTENLDKQEWKIMKKHPERGYKIASASEEFAQVSEEVLALHERWDGKGYPQGLAGEEIPLLARIVNIVHAYDVMTNERPYKDPMSKEEAIKELKKYAGSQFDPGLVDIFVKKILE